jgi:dihydrolipoamide dehydrogenase
VPVWPDIDGLDTVPVWTSDEALTARERPRRLLVLGGGPIGCELAQAYSAFGTEVTIVDTSDRLLPHEDPPISQAMMTIERAAAVRLELGAGPERVEPHDGGVRMHLENGRTLEADRLLLVVGRRPATDGLRATAAGARMGPDGQIEIDRQCRAADRLWAIGDVTAIAPYTHTANQQARVVVDVDLAEVSRAGAQGEGPLGPKDSSGGVLRLVADPGTRRLIGAAAVGPNADAWIGEAAPAIRAGIAIELLADVVRPFPTYAEAFTLGYDRLLTAVLDQAR